MQQPIKWDDVDLRLVVVDTPPPGNVPIIARCPMKEKHRDTEPSLRVYPDNIHCYGCGFHIARRRLYASFALLLGWWDGHGDDYEAAMRVKLELDLSKYYRSSVEAYRERAREDAAKKPMNTAVATVYHWNLMHTRKDRIKPLLKKRGITEEALARFQIGYDGTRYTIPLYSPDGKLLTIRYRRDDKYDKTGPKYEGTYGRNGLFLYPMDKLAAYGAADAEALAQGGVIRVVEGELDAVTLWEQGMVAVSPTNGAGQVKHVLRLLNESLPERTWKLLVIMTDQDEAGHKAAEELAQACVEAGQKYTRALWDAEVGKDITEYLLNNGKWGDIQYGQ